MPTWLELAALIAADRRLAAGKVNFARRFTLGMKRLCRSMEIPLSPTPYRID